MDLQGFLKAPTPRWVAIAAVAATGLASTGATFYFTRRKFYKDLDLMVADTVEKTEKFISSLGYKKYSTPMEALDALAEDPTVEDVDIILKAENYVEGDPVRVKKNIFEDLPEPDTEFDFETEMPKRSPEKPYIITYEEFFEGDNQTITLTWFEGDEVLADEKDEHIPDIEKAVGEDNLLRFGYGSRDPNIIYIRNEKMEVDFEVVKNEGKYTEQVLGFIQHEDKRGPRKFRTYDE